MDNLLDAEILEQVRVILRRDLKLSPDEPLPEEMPFFGGSIDLDSLDVLLLLTSIERQYGVKVQSQELAKEVFQSVGSLARFIEKNGVAKVAAVDWLAQLPHGPEFRFVSRVVEVCPGESAKGIWSVSGKEYFLAGHFPDSPIVPGVLIAEALAQICGLAGGAGGKQGKLAHIDLRFEQAIKPPAEIELNAKLARLLGDLQMFDVTAQAGAIIAARGTITLHRPETT